MSKYPDIKMKKPKKRLKHTPYLDAWIARLKLRLIVPEARAKLLDSLEHQDPRGKQFWQVRLSELLYRRRRPNPEVLLMIDAWMNAR